MLVVSVLYTAQSSFILLNLKLSVLAFLFYYVSGEPLLIYES